MNPGAWRPVVLNSVHQKGADRRETGMSNPGRDEMREHTMSSNTTIGLQNTFEHSDEARPSFLARWYSNFMKAQIARGERHAAQHLKSLSPQMLVGFGLTAEEATQVRRTGKLPASFWSDQR